MKEVMIITGASRGIGAATAILAAKKGYDVCINYQGNQSAAESVAKQIKNLGANVITVQADISQEADVIRLFDTVDQKLGTITALVNNAGKLEQQTTFDKIDVARFHRILAINVMGSFMCSKEAVKRMSTRLGGHGGGIVNISSNTAITGSPNEYIDYAASKGALDSMTIGLAKEVANEGIRVNGVRPGLIFTQMHESGGEANRVKRLESVIPMQRGGYADEVAQAVLWLLSSESSFTTGDFIKVSGGL